MFIINEPILVNLLNVRHLLNAIDRMNGLVRISVVNIR
jgi:hypothetical protein